MSFIELILLSCALAMDAFAVSLCKGFSAKTLTLKHYLIVGIYFGGFQALMPALGFLVGVSFSSFIQKIDHWIAFVLLVFIGFKMMKEGFEKESCPSDDGFHFKTMLTLAIATSIDALAVGVSFAFLQVSLTLALFLIGGTTFIFCVVALKMGNRFGVYLKSKAELLGGGVLILLGFKILISHLFWA
ncbi:manganese efflux pump MntP [Campylobacter vulpis]|uniref:manganese efflux pump MntP n=1 Tax=Campylobacter vulpis TaxID=1655500 RepID=UPI001BCE2015|nr:manganese efflux pump MntP family protein [Campylobacter vulpis]MBS4235580.1 manganese efflux pump [Campylobacter vulpis]MBS4269160.1 manganese efflux pump [Campylobacter vulpis]